MTDNTMANRKGTNNDLQKTTQSTNESNDLATWSIYIKPGMNGMFSVHQIPPPLHPPKKPQKKQQNKRRHTWKKNTSNANYLHGFIFLTYDILHTSHLIIS